MSDGRSNRKARVIPFISKLDKDRQTNFKFLLERARLLKMDGFNLIEWHTSAWVVTAGRLVKATGKNTTKSTFNFNYSPKLGGDELVGEWSDLIKSLMLLRFHRKNQTASNQRNFITAAGYVAHCACNKNLSLIRLSPEIFDEACQLISSHYSNGTAYNLHKAVAEFSAYCDANELCRIVFKYKYAGMKRPLETGGIQHKRLDDPEVLDTKHDKLISPEVFRVIGSLYLNVSKDHKYRFYVLFLTLLVCLGRRFSEISLLPYQGLSYDRNNKAYINYFPRKASQGDVFTPSKKLYLPSDVIPIVDSVLKEFDELCVDARNTAKFMQENNTADLSIIMHIKDDQRLYKDDLVKIGLPENSLSTIGWIRKQGLSFEDLSLLTKNGSKPVSPIRYTTKEGLIAYLTKDYKPSLIESIHIDQFGKNFYLKDMLLVKYVGSSSGAYTKWLATQCTHSMMTTFMRYFEDLAKEFVSVDIQVDFTTHHFRHTLNTLLDEGGLSDLLQTEWFGRSNPRDTKAYQHTSREKRALILRQDILEGKVKGKITEQVMNLPVNIRDAFLKARVNAVHDVGTGICIHNFAQLPCERHLQCVAECKDYVWTDNDEGRIEDLKRQYAMQIVAHDTAIKKSKSSKPKKSIDWMAHSEKKLKVLLQQLFDNGINEFDAYGYLEELSNA